MYPNPLIKEVIQELLREESSKLLECWLVWEDEQVLSFRWRLHGDMTTQGAKVLKRPGGGWQLLSREI